MLDTILKCRHSIISVLSILCLTIIALYIKTDVATIAVSIAGIAGANAGFNNYGKIKGVPDPGTKD